MKFSEFLNEGRPRIVHFLLRKTKFFWVLKNIDDGSHIRLPQFNIGRLITFLRDVNAYDNERPITSGFNFDIMRDTLHKTGQLDIYIPANRIEYMKTIYGGSGSPYGNTPNYNFTDKTIDTFEYEKPYQIRGTVK